MGRERRRASRDGRRASSWWSGRGSSSRGGGKDHLRRHPEGNGREQDRSDQGSARRSSRLGVGGSEGLGRGRAQNAEGRRDQGRSRRDQEKGRSGGGQG